MLQAALRRRPSVVPVVQVMGVWTAIAMGAVHSAPASDDDPQARPAKLTPLPAEAPAPKTNPTTAAKVHLGRRLFFDTRLSGDNKMSCATCHLPEKAFADGRARSPGAGGKLLTRHTQSVLNVGFFDSYFWDGRAKTLEQQALAPITSPEEMNQDLDALEKELADDPRYVREFQEVFGKPVGRRELAQALAAFQRTLITRNSPFDRFLAGDAKALSESARRGYELFVGEAGCIECHNGPMLSDGKFYRLGIGRTDRGRGAVTGRREDDYKFRTPTLRDVARTAPYMHDGSQATLFDVVQFYFRGVPARGPDGLPLDVQPLLGQSFSDIDAIVAFLQSLTGELPDIEPPQDPGNQDSKSASP